MGVGVEPDIGIQRPPADRKKAEAIARFSKAYDHDPKQCEHLLSQLDRVLTPPKKLEIVRKVAES